MPASANRSAAASRIMVELDGVRVGAAEWAEGGEPMGEVAEPTTDPSGLAKKHITTIKWTPIRITIGAGMGDALVDWIKAFTARQATKKNGAIVLFNANGKPRSRLEWSDGLITEVCFPALEAADRTPGALIVTIQPDHTVTRAATQEAPFGAGIKSKAWLLGNFRVAIDNIPNDTKRVMRVESIVVRRKLIEMRDGASRFTTILLGAQQVGDVILTLPDGQASELAAWAQDFLLQGHSGDADERNGAIEYLDPAMRPLFTLSLKHLGIYRLGRERAAGQASLARAKACLYCEELRFDRAAGLAGSVRTRPVGRITAPKTAVRKPAKKAAKKAARRRS